MSDNPFTSATFNRFLSEHKMMGTRCRADGRIFLPPRELCPESHDEMEWVELSGQGKLAGFTVIYVAPSAMLAAGFDRKNPYCVGVVRLAEGPAISAQILGVDVKNPAQITIGMPLRVTFVERGEGNSRRTFPAFEPMN